MHREHRRKVLKAQESGGGSVGEVQEKLGVINEAGMKRVLAGCCGDLWGSCWPSSGQVLAE